MEPRYLGCYKDEGDALGRAWEFMGRIPRPALADSRQPCLKITSFHLLESAQSPSAALRHLGAGE